MTKWAGIAFGLGLVCAVCAGCGLDDFGIGDAGVDGQSSVTSNPPIDGSLSGGDDAPSSPPGIDAAAADAAPPPELVDAKVADVGADALDASELLLDAGVDGASAEADACVPPPVDWTWLCEGQGIGAGSMCIESSGSTMGIPMPYDCRQCMSAYTCACVLAHFGEENACGTAFVDGGNVTIAPVSCTDVPDAGQLVVCP
jgi:hypothetical protein